MTTTEEPACAADEGVSREWWPEMVENWPPLWSRAQWLRLDWWRRAPRRPAQWLWWDPSVDSLCDALVRLPRSSRLIRESHAEDSLAQLVSDLGAARAVARLSAEDTVEDLEDMWQAYASEPVPIVLVAAALRGWTAVRQRDAGPR